MNIKKEIKALHKLTYEAFVQAGRLETVLIEDNQSSSVLNEDTDKLAGLLEKATLDARCLREYCYFENQTPKHPPGPHSPPLEIAGRVELDEYGWLHITLNTLLPHAKYKGSPYLKDTILRLLTAYQQEAGPLPFYSSAMLVIDEHCNLESRRAFDQDNKGWKAVPNALKGLVIADDDQFSLGVALISTWDKTPTCHIYVMDKAEAGTFFAFHTGDCGTYFR